MSTAMTTEMPRHDGKEKTRLAKYGPRAYHVLIDGEHWGNVCGYERRARRNVAWTATWFLRAGRPGAYTGRIENLITRHEAVREVVINTKPDRVFQPARSVDGGDHG
jgi:hypothetical protein